MSDYLVQRIETSPKITVHPFTEVTALAGDDYLRQVTLTDRQSGESRTLPIANLFLMIGAAPNTDWLAGCLALDPQGFVPTVASAIDPQWHTLRTTASASGPTRMTHA